MYHGTVKDSKGIPLEGIRVTDGRNVVLTDSVGVFSLPGWEKTAFICCCVLTKGHSDWYISVQKNRDTYDFVLDPVLTEDEYCFLHISDTEVGEAGCGRFVPWVRETAEKTNAAFVVHTGDICYEAGLRRHWQDFNFDTVGCPVRYGIGNHDFLDEGYAYAEQGYEKWYGPCWYSFDVGSVHYVMLAISSGGVGQLRYTFQEQCRWLENDLATARNRTLVVMRHNKCAEAPDYKVNLGDHVFDFKEYGLAAWLVGHYHTNFMQEYNGVLLMTAARADSGGIDSCAAGVRRVTVSGRKLETDMIYNVQPCEGEDAVWKTTLPGNISFSPILPWEGDLLVATVDDGYPKKCGIYRLSGKTGEILWFCPTENSVKNHMAAEDGKVYAQDCGGTAYCVDAGTGHLLWTSAAAKLGRYLENGVILTGGKLFVGGASCPTFLDKNTGEVLWQMERAPVSASPAGTVTDPEGKTLFVSGQWKSLFALDVQNGEIKWELLKMKKELGVPGPFWFRTSTPLYYEGKIYAFGFGCVGVADAASGEVLQLKNLELDVDVCGAACVFQDTLYLPTATSSVVALDKDTFAERHRYEVGGACVFTAPYIYGAAQTVESGPVIWKDMLVFAASDGCVYFCDTNSPAVYSKVKLASPALTTPALAENCLYAASFDGTVGKYSVKK